MTVRRFLVLVLVLLQLSAAEEGAAAERFEPRDESHEDPSFVAFRKELNNAIEKKDTAFVKKILSDDVEYSFGADPERKSPIDGFISHYELGNGNKSKVWEVLKNVIELGCTKAESSFICPYVYSRWPNSFDSYSYIATIKAKAPIREKPHTSAKVQRLASFEILKLDAKVRNSEWHVITLGDKSLGYIARSDARSPIDYRAEFRKTPKGWKLRYLIAGD